MQSNPLYHQFTKSYEKSTDQEKRLAFRRKGKTNFRVCTARAISRNWQASKSFAFSKDLLLSRQQQAERRKMLMLIVDGEKTQKRQARYSRWVNGQKEKMKMLKRGRITFWELFTFWFRNLCSENSHRSIDLGSLSQPCFLEEIMCLQANQACGINNNQ